MLDVAVCLVFPSLMAYAAASDLMTMTISNRISILLVVAFIGLGLALGLDWHSVVLGHLACGAAMLALAFALFAFGWIGGGDAKLAAATAVWLGWDDLFAYGLAASVAGGALTLAILALRRVELPAVLQGQPWAMRLHEAGNGVPYGIALAASGLLLYPDTSVWSAAIRA